jgi:hypothetical protein
MEKNVKASKETKMKIKHYKEFPNDANPTGAIEWSDGVQLKQEICIRYYVDGIPHRINGPAVEYLDGEKEYWLNGSIHREDGPAIIWDCGKKEWWLNGKIFFKEDWKIEVEKLKKSGLDLK